jgi:hypothetical protein
MNVRDAPPQTPQRDITTSSYGGQTPGGSLRSHRGPQKAGRCALIVRGQRYYSAHPAPLVMSSNPRLMRAVSSDLYHIATNTYSPRSIQYELAVGMLTRVYFWQFVPLPVTGEHGPAHWGYWKLHLLDQSWWVHQCAIVSLWRGQFRGFQNTVNSS